MSDTTTTAITNICDNCRGERHQSLEVLQFDARQLSWLCGYCRAAPKDRPVDLDVKPAKVYPKVSPLILDGLVRVFSSCRDCSQIMQVTSVRDTVHPMCQPRSTQVENWEQTWLAIAKGAPHEQLPAHLRRKLDDLEYKMDSAADAKTALANAAMAYAEQGWPVFPLARHSKKPAIPKDKGGKGFLDATTDVDRICKWWSRHPDHNIGLATGHLFDVVDIDPGAGGVTSLSKLLHDNRIPYVHGIVATAGADEPEFRPSGMHLYVKPTGKGNFAGLLPGVDYRGIGGYVVAPPSTLGNRVRSWSWAVQPSPEVKGGN